MLSVGGSQQSGDLVQFGGVLTLQGPIAQFPNSVFQTPEHHLHATQLCF